MSLPFDLDAIAHAGPRRRRSRQARVAWNNQIVTLGGDAPVRVQSMTNTDTIDVIGTAIQVKDSVLENGDTSWIELEFLTRDFFGPVSKTFAVKTDLPGRERIEMIYTAIIGQWMWGVKPTPISAFLLQGQAVKRIQISNVTNDKTAIEGFHADDTTFTVEIVKPSAERGGQMVFDVKAVPNLADGTYESNVTLNIRASGSEKPILVTVPVKIVRF